LSGVPVETTFAFGGVGTTCCTRVNTRGVGEVFRLLPRNASASALLLPGEDDNRAAVDRPLPELRTYEHQFPDPGNHAFRIDSLKTFGDCGSRRLGRRDIETTC